MHVRTAWSLSLALALATACADQTPKRKAPVLSRDLPGAAALNASVDAQTLALARAARDAATAYAKQCSIERYYSDNAARFYDDCSLDEATARAYRAAAATLLAVAPDAGDGIIFVEHVRLFDQWVASTDRHSRARGTLAHYQYLAGAWNAFQPGDPIAVVPVAAAGRGGKTDLPKTDGGALPWQRCGDGPCIIVPR